MLATGLLVVLTMTSFGRAEAMVPRLGASSYAARERIGRELVQLGRHALPALRRGQIHKDLEIAERCKRLTPLAEAEASRQRFAFMESLLAARPLRPVPWDEFLLARFLAVTDDSAASRELYLDIYRAHGPFLDMVESSSPREAGRAFWKYVDRSLMYPDGRTTVDLRALKFNQPDLALFWFLSADPGFWPATCRGTNRPDFPYYFPRHADGHLAGPDSSLEMRRLFIRWLAGPRNLADPGADQRMLTTGLQLATAARLKEVRPIALSAALGPKQSRDSRAAALVALRQFGLAEDVARLSTLVEDNGLVYKPSPVRDPERQIVVGDLALAACVRLHGQKLADFGFIDSRAAANAPESISDYQFPNDEARKAARKKWAEVSTIGTLTAGGKQ